MKTIVFIALIFLLTALQAQPNFTADSLRLRHLYGETETFDAAFAQIKTIGADAPFLTFTTAEGHKINSENFSNKVILIHFWFLTCGGCIIENPLLNRITDTLQNNSDFQLIAFANNSNEELQHFLNRDSLYFGSRWNTIKRHPLLNFTIAADPEEEIFNRFKSWSYPGNIIIDRNGIIRKIIYRHELDMSEEEFFDYLLAQIKELL